MKQKEHTMKSNGFPTEYGESFPDLVFLLPSFPRPLSFLWWECRDQGLCDRFGVCLSTSVQLKRVNQARESRGRSNPAFLLHTFT